MHLEAASQETSCTGQLEGAGEQAFAKPGTTTRRRYQDQRYVQYSRRVVVTVERDETVTDAVHCFGDELGARLQLVEISG